LAFVRQLGGGFDFGDLDPSADLFWANHAAAGLGQGVDQRADGGFA